MMIAVKCRATAAVRIRSRDRVAAPFSSTHASSSSSSSAGHPSQTLCARTANRAPTATASTRPGRSNIATSPDATASTSGSTARTRSGVKYRSTTARYALCSAPSIPFGTCRCRETPLANVVWSSATAVTSACANSVHAPSGPRATGHWDRSAS
ncbi:hypothetical protein [Cellulomonas soli]